MTPDVKDTNTFLGHPVAYWLELEHRAKSLRADSLITEIALLRAKVSFYESRINELTMFMRAKLEVSCDTLGARK